jgi:hypothetical protein
MTQPTVFVTYLPKRALDRRAAQERRPAAEPLAALLASLFVAGGAFATLVPSAGQAATPHGAIARVVLSKAGPDHFAERLPVATRQIGATGRRDIVAGGLGFAERAKSGQKGKTTASHGREVRPDFAEVVALRDQRPPIAVPSEPAESARLTSVAVTIDAPALSVQGLPSEKLIETGIVNPPTLPSGAVADDGPTYPMVYVGANPVGSITMRGDRVHLASLIGLLNLRMPNPEFDRLQGLPGADCFVALERLRDAGIEAKWNQKRDRLILALR